MSLTNPFVSLMNLFKKQDKAEDDIVITEGVEGYWHYHLSHKDNTKKSLCDCHTMHTSLPLNSWGTITHLHERYCKRCWEIYNRKNILNKSKDP